MWKNRLGYICITAGCMVLLFMYSSPFLVYTCLLLVAAALVMGILLHREARNLKVDLNIEPAGLNGENVHPVMTLEAPVRLWASGYAMVEVSIQNLMFNTKEKKRFLMPVRGRENSFELPVATEKCGEVSVECRNVWIYDMFRLFRFRGKGFEEVRTVIFPGKVKIRLDMKRTAAGSRQEEGIVQNRRGNDPSEMFDIREYVPGDDIRSIHWKLSSKTDSLILREASDPSHYNVVVMPDFGLNQLGESATEKEINTAVGIGASVCRQLVHKGIPFCMAFPTVNGLKFKEVRSRRDYQRMLSQWLCIQIQKNSGDGLKYFVTEHMEQHFSKLIILSAGQYGQHMGSLDGQMEVTVLNTSENREDVMVSRAGTCETVEIPVKNNKDTVYRITC